MFQKELSRKNIKAIHENKTRYEKLQYDINRKASKISLLSSCKIDRYKYLTGEEILPSNQKIELKNKS